MSALEPEKVEAVLDATRKAIPLQAFRADSAEARIRWILGQIRGDRTDRAWWISVAAVALREVLKIDEKRRTALRGERPLSHAAATHQD